ncbi:MAG: hypothetical protein BGP06_16200 [Rhizobiales bacterium 65-9]|nr:DUF2267 domain-containing protein [Hyphomicrobiales bacterium]OJY38007.1 MAG: hypothetical protein BGP06_16200 [Rhizobiales bacterium 65-9]
MDELIARLSAAAGVDAETATKAVGMILAFLRKEAPGESVESLIGQLPGAEDAISGAGGGGMMGALGGMMGGGVMALGGQLMGAGLDMGQIQTIGRELFAFGREKAGEDKMGEIIGQIPGLSQFV